MRTKWRDGYVEWTGLVLQEPEMCCTLITALTNQAVITGILPVACNCPILLFESHQDFNSWRAVPASQKGMAWPQRCLGWKLRVTTGVGVPPAAPWVPGGGTPRRCPSAPSPAGGAGSQPSSPAPAPPLRLRHLTGQCPPAPARRGRLGCRLRGSPAPSPAAPRGWHTAGPEGWEVRGSARCPPSPPELGRWARARVRGGWRGRPVWLLSGAGTGTTALRILTLPAQPKRRQETRCGEIMFCGTVWGVSLREHGTSLCSRGQSRPQRGHLP